MKEILKKTSSTKKLFRSPSLRKLDGDEEKGPVLNTRKRESQPEKRTHIKDADQQEFDKLLQDLPAKIDELLNNNDKNPHFFSGDKESEWQYLMAALIYSGDLRNIKRLLDAKNSDGTNKFSIEESIRFMREEVGNTTMSTTNIINPFIAANFGANTVQFIGLDNDAPNQLETDKFEVIKLMIKAYPELTYITTLIGTSLKFISSRQETQGTIKETLDFRLDLIERLIDFGANLNKPIIKKAADADDISTIAENAKEMFLLEFFRKESKFYIKAYEDTITLAQIEKCFAIIKKMNCEISPSVIAVFNKQFDEWKETEENILSTDKNIDENDKKATIGRIQAMQKIRDKINSSNLETSPETTTNGPRKSKSEKTPEHSQLSRSNTQKALQGLETKEDQIQLSVQKKSSTIFSELQTPQKRSSLPSELQTPHTKSSVTSELQTPHTRSSAPSSELRTPHTRSSLPSSDLFSQKRSSLPSSSDKQKFSDNKSIRAVEKTIKARKLLENPNIDQKSKDKAEKYKNKYLSPLVKLDEALYYGLSTGNAEIIDFCLFAPQNIETNIVDKNGNVALTLALQNDHKINNDKVIELLIERHDFNAEFARIRKVTSENKDSEKNAEIWKNSTLYLIVKNGYPIRIFEKILKNVKFDELDKNLQTLIFDLAVKNNYVSYIKIILKNSPNIQLSAITDLRKLNSYPECESTTLIKDIREIQDAINNDSTFADIQRAEALVEKYDLRIFDERLKNKKENLGVIQSIANGVRAVTLKSGNIQGIALLIKDSDSFSTNDLNIIIKNYSQKKESKDESNEASETAHLLFVLEKAKERNIINQIDQAEQIPLHLAIASGNLVLIKKLLENGADPNIINKDGNTALHLLALKNENISDNDKAIIQLLLENGAAKSLYTKNKNGVTPEVINPSADFNIETIIKSLTAASFKPEIVKDFVYLAIINNHFSDYLNRIFVGRILKLNPELTSTNIISEINKKLTEDKYTQLKQFLSINEESIAQILDLLKQNSYEVKKFNLISKDNILIEIFNSSDTNPEKINKIKEFLLKDQTSEKGIQDITDVMNYLNNNSFNKFIKNIQEINAKNINTKTIDILFSDVIKLSIETINEAIRNKNHELAKILIDKAIEAGLQIDKISYKEDYVIDAKLIYAALTGPTINIIDDKANTALHLAVKNGYDKSLNILLKDERSRELLSVKNLDGQNVSDLAKKLNSNSLLSALRVIDSETKLSPTKDDSGLLTQERREGAQKIQKIIGTAKVEYEQLMANRDQRIVQEQESKQRFETNLKDLEEKRIRDKQNLEEQAEKISKPKDKKDKTKEDKFAKNLRKNKEHKNILELFQTESKDGRIQIKSISKKDVKENKATELQRKLTKHLPEDFRNTLNNFYQLDDKINSLKEDPSKDELLAKEAIIKKENEDINLAKQKLDKTLNLRTADNCHLDVENKKEELKHQKLIDTNQKKESLIDKIKPILIQNISTEEVVELKKQLAEIDKQIAKAKDENAKIIDKLKQLENELKKGSGSIIIKLKAQVTQMIIDYQKPIIELQNSKTPLEEKLQEKINEELNPLVAQLQSKSLEEISKKFETDTAKNKKLSDIAEITAKVDSYDFADNSATSLAYSIANFYTVDNKKLNAALEIKIAKYIKDISQGLIYEKSFKKPDLETKEKPARQKTKPILEIVIEELGTVNKKPAEEIKKTILEKINDAITAENESGKVKSEEKDAQNLSFSPENESEKQARRDLIKAELVRLYELNTEELIEEVISSEINKSKSTQVETKQAETKDAARRSFSSNRKTPPPPPTLKPLGSTIEDSQNSATSRNLVSEFSQTSETKSQGSSVNSPIGVQSRVSFSPSAESSNEEQTSATPEPTSLGSTANNPETRSRVSSRVAPPPPPRPTRSPSPTRDVEKLSTQQNKSIIPN